MTRAYVGIGSNLERPREQVLRAFGELGRIAATRVTRKSSLYRSAPVGYADQPDFINAVAEIDTLLSASKVLVQLKQIEARHGRKRSFRNAPRTLDLDLLLYGNKVILKKNLVIPHPRMHERAFVLKPLLEIAPRALIPGVGAAQSRLKKLPPQVAAKIR